MKISLEWLKDYVKVDLPLASLLDKLTMIGLVVENFEEDGGTPSWTSKPTPTGRTRWGTSASPARSRP